MDWNDDGNLDILSGCYWTKGEKAGFIHVLHGKGDGKDATEFENPTPLLNSSKKPIQNNRAPSANQSENICTHQHAVDYDGDGDLDLVVGCFTRIFFLHENIGEENENLISDKPKKLSIQSPDLHAGPHLVDFDGDGDLDLLTGSNKGGVLISKNEGTREEPEYGKFKLLVPKPKPDQPTAFCEETKMAIDTRVWATDINGDGLMDLLVGDQTQVLVPIDGLSRQEYDRKKIQLEKKYAKLLLENRELVSSGERSAADGEKESRRLFGELAQETEPLVIKKPTGLVWQVLQKPISEKTEAH